jgi:hypothetical protein
LLPKRTFFSLVLALLLSTSGAHGQLGLPGLRVMPVEELSTQADTILRGRVKKIEKANYLGKYTQLVSFQVLDVVKGDSSLIGQETKIWAGTRVSNAKDSYIKGVEVLVFLEHEQTFYYTLNFQYGQFLIEGDAVQRWRVAPPPPPTLPPPAPLINGNGGSQESSQTQPDLVDITQPDSAFNLISKDYTAVRKEIIGYLLPVNQEESIKKTTTKEP